MIYAYNQISSGKKELISHGPLKVCLSFSISTSIAQANRHGVGVQPLGTDSTGIANLPVPDIGPMWRPDIGLFKLIASCLKWLGECIIVKCQLKYHN